MKKIKKNNIIRFLNLSIENKRDRSNYTKEVNNFLKKGIFMMGEEVIKFENNIKNFLNKKYCVGVSSGTNAIYLSLRALGIKKNDEILVPCMSWYSTFSVVKVIGAKPISCDIDNDLIIDINDVVKKINKRTKAIIIVHFTGLLKDHTKLYKLCKEKGIKVIEDCAQAFGTSVNNKYVGSFSDISAFSMNPMKVYGAFGEAGCICTNNYNYYRKLLTLRYAGVDMKKDECIYPELNHKIDSIQALVLNIKLKKFRDIHLKRIENASIYEKYLTNKVVKPKFYNDKRHLYYTYTILTNERIKLQKYLEKHSIQTRIQHKKIMEDHIGFKVDNLKRNINGNVLKNQVLSLPVHENLKKNEIMKTIKIINDFFT